MKYKAKEDKSNAMILLPLHPVSLMHKNSVRCKIIIHGMHSVAGSEIAPSWSPMRPKIPSWRLEFHSWSPAGDL